MKIVTIVMFVLFLQGCNGCQPGHRHNTSGDDSEGIVAQAGEYGLTRLGQACYRGDLGEVKKLLGEGEDETRCMTDEIYEYDLLYAAVYFGQRDILKWVIDRKSDLNTVYNEDGVTALWLACRNSNFELASMLVGAGANVDGAGDCGGDYVSYPLLESLRNGNADLVGLLLDAGADTDIRDKQGYTYDDYQLFFQEAQDKKSGGE